ncbi:uncharacterized protein LOC117176669 [Belonocnema kinseyi]|uniref:uncharacterized protein LOC117176669 n=1 Tax=Belonocnema kinseyi TaxID=2817044 RepID=UPI00143D1F47|nr:uncharacterized protein LOC117176669 [Belonocnema kinseyi]
MNNSVFGKKIENFKIKKNVKLVTKWEEKYDANALIVKPNLHSCTIFDENIVIIEINKTKIFFNKPNYIDFTALDTSKIITDDFQYKHILSNFGNSAKLLYTDTDSLIYQYTVPNFYEYIKQDIHKFNTSDYQPDNVYGIPPKNKKALGLMKDECNGKIITEFVGLRSKLYAYKVLGEQEDEKKTAKDIKGSTSKTITFDDYKLTLISCQNLIKTQHLI